MSLTIRRDQTPPLAEQLSKGTEQARESDLVWASNPNSVKAKKENRIKSREQSKPCESYREQTPLAGQPGGSL